MNILHSELGCTVVSQVCYRYSGTSNIIATCDRGQLLIGFNNHDGPNLQMEHSKNFFGTLPLETISLTFLILIF